MSTTIQQSGTPVISETHLGFTQDTITRMLKNDERNVYELTPSSGVIPAFKETLLNDDVKSVTAELAETAIDSILENDALIGIPIVGAVAAFCKTGMHLRERHFIKETLNFIVGFNNGTLSAEEFNQHEARITASEATMEKELERVTLLLDSHIYSNQSRRLGGFYAAYRTGAINWNTFAELSEANSRMFEADFPTLCKIGEGLLQQHGSNYRAERLVSIGLIVNKGPTLVGSTLTLGVSNYECTTLGKQFLRFCK